MVMMTSSNGNIFRVTGHHQSPMNSRYKGQWRGALMFFLICVWINGWVSSRDAGDSRRYHAHYDVIVMVTIRSHAAMFMSMYIQYIPRNMHTVFALLCFVVVIHWLIFPYPSGLLHWHCGNLTIAPVPAKQPWWIWINTSCEFIRNDCITTTKQKAQQNRVHISWDIL